MNVVKSERGGSHAAGGVDCDGFCSVVGVVGAAASVGGAFRRNICASGWVEEGPNCCHRSGGCVGRGTGFLLLVVL